jgi:hypothetical protein
MRLHTIFLLAISILMASTAFSQNRTLERAVVLSGGTFETGTGPFKDFGSIGYYNPSNQSYQFKDSVFSQSVQNGFILGNEVIFGAQDSVIRYNLNSESRVNQFAVPQISFVTGDSNRLAVGNFSIGINPDFPIVGLFNTNDFSAIDTIPNDSLSSPADVAFYGDKAYLGFNISKQNSRSDSVGRIAVYNFASNTYEQNLKLDTLSAGISKLFVFNDKVHGVCGKYGRLMTLDPSNGSVTYQQFNLSRVRGPVNGKLYGVNPNREVEAFNPANGNRNNLGITISADSGIFVNGFNYDVVNNKAYVAKTNFSDTGYVEIYNASNGQEDTSFTTNVSVTEILFDYSMNTSVGNLEDEDNSIIRTYPNPVQHQLNVTLPEDIGDQATLSLLNLKGVTLKEQTVSNQSTARLNLSSLPSGTYVVRLQTARSTITQRVVKQ